MSFNQALCKPYQYLEVRSHIQNASIAAYDHIAHCSSYHRRSNSNLENLARSFFYMHRHLDLPTLTVVDITYDIVNLFIQS